MSRLGAKTNNALAEAAALRREVGLKDQRIEDLTGALEQMEPLVTELTKNYSTCVERLTATSQKLAVAEEALKRIVDAAEAEGGKTSWIDKVFRKQHNERREALFQMRVIAWSALKATAAGESDEDTDT